MQIGTNHLGHFALTNLLLPHVTDRVVTVASSAHRVGRIDLDDLYWERNLSPWDMAAGQIIIREAGGTVSGIEGDDDPLKTGNLICGNEFVHAELVKILKPLGK